MSAKTWSFIAEGFIDAQTIEWAAKDDCPPIFREFLSQILVDALCINGEAGIFRKCKYEEGKYRLSWYLENGEEYMKDFSLEELLNSLKGKDVDCDCKVYRYLKK